MTYDRNQRRALDRYLEKEYSRRRFLADVGTAAGAAALGGIGLGLAGCRPPAAATDAGKVATDSGPPPVAQALVGAGSGATVRESIDLAIAHTMGGWDWLQPGQSVLIKVNSNSGVPYPFTSNPESVTALVNKLFEGGAGRVVVGDRSFFGANTNLNLNSNGIRAAGLAAGAEVVVFDENNPAFGWVTIPAADAPDWTGSFRLPALFGEVDHIIHLPIVKTHFIAYFTMTLKTTFGSVHAGDRMLNLNPHSTAGGLLWRMIGQVAAAYTPTLHVLDGQTPVITGGPDMGDTLPGVGLMFASTDRIATDVTGVGLLKDISTEPAITSRGVWEQPQIVDAIARGIGIGGAASWSLEGTGGTEYLDAIRAWVTA